MGRQFSFFLGPEDREPFRQSLLQSPDIVFLDDQPLINKPEVLLGLSETSFRTLLFRKADLNEISFNPVPSQPYFVSDSYTSNIIECDEVTAPYNNFLIEGRLYYNAWYYDESGYKVEKSDAFLKWAESLFRRTKKSLTKVDLWFYAGEDALKLRSEGLKFSQLDGSVWSSEAAVESGQEFSRK